MMHEKTKAIRTALRLAMNGVVATSMREKGVLYKLNFGVSLHRLHTIAANYQGDDTLAAHLWGEDIREFKILATLIQSPATCTAAQAAEWINDVHHQEIAEQLVMNLLQHLPYGEALAVDALAQPRGYVPLIGLLLLARLCMAGVKLKEETVVRMLHVSAQALSAGTSALQRAALVALKRYGGQQPSQGIRVLQAFEGYKNTASVEAAEYYADLAFEFEERFGAPS